MLERIAEALGPLRRRMVLLGGCATGLLLTDPAAAPIRATRDVDMIVETPGRSGDLKLEKELTKAGFSHDQSVGAPICRWTLGDLFVDVMPTDPSVLGFSNRWYPEALDSSWLVRLPSGVEVSVASPAAFLATKLEAYFSSGQGDFVASHDIEDFDSVVDGREEIVDEIRASHEPVRRYLSVELGRLLADERFLSALAGHLPSDRGSQARLPILLQRLRAVATGE
jgi:predicted nucleotidyltransferase